ncbi:MAG TPA: nucleotide sugar dehydrogenase [Deltaproteobacteria bacterium]|nr:nucleotide sugar dehydrogenase [Deltaproteobacteria bacterium]HOM29866.1 nucleotide sugar dehydrogenase [Deltaproteobacteria bacterium]HPP80679.1 nucleotide sugar dehydrogenase [Deltaproteobacteria bacterium]
MDHRIAVIGLGYVGLPLAVEFGRRYPTLGFDINPRRIEELRSGMDRTREVSPAELAEARLLDYTFDASDLERCNTYVVTVPTPIDAYNRPDLSLLMDACNTVGRALGKGDIVIFESTVYPGCTEEECVPALERASGLTYNEDFFCGYSPERINPGDRRHRLTDIVKVTSGSTPRTARIVDELYRSIIRAGTHPAPSIKVAEAAKVIENAQRDINIAFVNELALIFARMGIKTSDVLAAASTKWNFLSFSPGLVGGHCIGVDPYYLTHKAEGLGYIPQVILAGRRINDSMGRYVATELIKMMVKRKHRITDSRVLVLGVTFKENCPDIRNSKVMDIITELREFECTVDVFDPVADPQDVRDAYGIEIMASEDEIQGTYEGIVAAVAHDAFRDMDLSRLKAPGCVVYDVKSIYPDADAYL